MSEIPHPLFSADEYARLLFETMPLGVVYQNTSGEILTANPAAQKILGLSLDQLQGRTSFDPRWRAIREDGTDFPGTEHPAMLALRTGAEVRDVVMGVFNPQTESVTWILINAVPQFKQPGTAPYMVFTTFEDITARKQVEQKLLESEVRYRLISENAADVIWMLNPYTGRFIYVSPSVEKLRGFTPAEVMAQPVSMALTPESQKMVSATLAANLPAFIAQGSGTMSFVNEVDQPHKNGSIVHTEVTTTYLFNLQGEVELIGVTRDITARKQAEAALRESEEKYSALFYQAAMPVLLLKMPERVIVDINRAFENMTGYTRQELIKNNPVQLGIVSAAEIQRVYAEFQKQNVLRDVEAHFLSKTGTVCNVIINASIVEVGGQKYVLFTHQDITARKQAEEQLHLSHARLAELSRRMVNMQEEERRMIGREMHDQIGQMLTAIKITLDVAQQLPVEEALKKIQRAQDVVGDLLHRISRLSLDLRPPMLDDLGLIPALLWLINRFQEETGTALDFKHSAVEDIRFDAGIETTAYRIIQEALTNAARHAQARRIQLEVRADEEHMQITIKDDGQGFDPESAFAQNRGLSGMRERAKLLGGALYLHSQAGQGAVIQVSLPLRKQ